jgi:hypothetical protein
MTKTHDDVRDRGRALREAKARLEAAITESKEDAAKRELHFGSFRTSEGDL